MASNFIQTKASLNRTKAANDFIAVSYKSHKSKRKLQHEDHQDETEETSSKPLSIKTPEINIKRAKQEIIKFGMTGFDAATQEEAKIKKAIKLGAKPKKNKHKNYKLLLEEKKKEKIAKEEQQKFQQLGKNNAGRATAKGKSFDKKRKLKNDILDIYGTVKPRDIKSMQKGRNFGKSKRK